MLTSAFINMLSATEVQPPLSVSPEGQGVVLILDLLWKRTLDNEISLLNSSALCLLYLGIITPTANIY